MRHCQKQSREWPLIAEPAEAAHPAKEPVDATEWWLPQRRHNGAVQAMPGALYSSI